MVGEALTFPNSCLHIFLINNKEKQFSRLLKKIKINMLPQLFEKNPFANLWDKNIYDFVIKVIFLFSQLLKLFYLNGNYCRGQKHSFSIRFVLFVLILSSAEKDLSADLLRRCSDEYNEL